MKLIPFFAILALSSSSVFAAELSASSADTATVAVVGASDKDCQNGQTNLLAELRKKHSVIVSVQPCEEFPTNWQGSVTVFKY